MAGGCSRVVRGWAILLAVAVVFGGCPGEDEDAGDDDAGDDDTSDDDGADDDSAGDDDGPAPLFHVVGEPGSRAGAAAGVCDLNGDGQADIAVGVPFDDPPEADAGTVRVWFGPVAGEQQLADADRTIRGTGSGERLGSAISCGDATGDGQVDLIVGVGSPVTFDRVLVFAGPILADLETGDAAGRVEDATRRADLVGAGDVDGDGLHDLVTFDDGGLRVVPGPITTTIDVSAAAAVILPSYFEWYFEPGPLCDVDGDLRVEVLADLIYWPSKSAEVLVYHEPIAGMLDEDAAWAVKTWCMPVDGEYYRFFACGDVSGDGIADLMLARPGGIDVHAPLSSVSVDHGPISAGTGWLGGDSRIENHLGETLSVFAGGDVTGDGIGDLLAGGWLFDGPVGVETTEDAIVRFDEPEIALLGSDVDGDGHGDLLLGDPLDDAGGTDAGAVWVYAGSELGGLVR